MIKKITQISFAITIALFLVSCKNTKQKMQDYVNSYNNSTSLMQDEVITHTSAKAFLQDNKIEIRIDTNLEQSKTNESIYKDMFPAFLGETMKKDPASVELINEGVTFEIYFLANNSTILAELKVDKEELNKLLAKNTTNSLDKKQNTESDSGSEMQQMLVLMNQNMPIVNDDGTKVLQIDLSNKNELVYKIEVPKQYSEILKGDGAKVLMKESILRSSDFKSILASVKRYGITTIKYVYQDKKGQFINDIVLTEKDLK
ncbi:hypothetical protein [Flavobacterium sp. HTF]|uniref:hypothetical protein n=1 Tax=Flavobacterium sp. HTF TaxID=2170732 RepID=UPI001A9C723E|nr:hypothetical protein [Flavobacterium sp. HTF]